MEKIVIDTSVAVKWFVEEKNSEEALKLLKDHHDGQIEIIAPEIICLELVNALFFGADYKGEILEKALSAFYDLNLSLVLLSKSFIQGARKYMEEYNIAIYDALFIFLAKKEKTLLITCDKKHHSKKFYKKIEYLA